MFGTNCSEQCGNCLSLDQCHHINGSCPDGCAPGFQGVTCTKGNSDSFIYVIEVKTKLFHFFNPLEHISIYVGVIENSKILLKPRTDKTLTVFIT